MLFFVLTTFLYNEKKKHQIIIIRKPDKDPQHVTSYRPISLLSHLSKVLEKLLVKRINAHLAVNQLIPTHQFGFRNKHATIEQVNKLKSRGKKVLLGCLSRRHSSLR